MAEKRDVDLPGFYPKEFDLDNFHLSFLASCAAVEIDNHILGRNDIDYSHITRLGKIIYMSTEPQFTIHNPSYTALREDPTLSVFLWKFLAKSTDKTPQTIDDVVSQTKDMALNLIKMKKLSREEQVGLRDLCVKLSESVSAYWHSAHPTGFRRYYAA